MVIQRVLYKEEWYEDQAALGLVAPLNVVGIVASRVVL